MLISHKHKFITIDIPKTGSRSLRESLHPLGLIDIVGEPSVEADFYQHDTAIRVKQQFLKRDLKWNNYYKFTIARNPWARYLSFFSYYKDYAQRYDNIDSAARWEPAQIKQGKMCSQLFKQHDDRTAFRHIINDTCSQDVFYLDHDENIIVDHVARFENLSNEFELLCKHAQIPHVELKHSNKSKTIEIISQLLDQEMIDTIAKKEKYTIELMKYINI